MLRFILALIIAQISILAHAGIGTVVELSGLAIIKRGKEAITVTKGAEIEMNDRIETKNGKVRIEFRDKTTVTVTEHSALVIDDFVYDPKAASGKISLRAAEGTVRYVSGAIAHNNPKNVNIKTPTATVAVRGTDFVMSVNEVGSSMIILMPSCDTTGCLSGIIDVNTGFGSVTMDKPYQATLVEGNAAPPTTPIIVNLNNSPIGNNLQIAPPVTSSGANVVAAAREAAAKTGDLPASAVVRTTEAQVKQDKSNNASQTTTPKENRTETAVIIANPVSDVIATASVSLTVSVIDEPASKEIISDTITAQIIPSNVKKIWSDKSQTLQVGWLYERLLGNNYTNIRLPLDTKVNITVNQDRQLDYYNFSLVPGQGTIIINQNYR